MADTKKEREREELRRVGTPSAAASLDGRSYKLCRINTFLHGVGFDKFDIACEDTLTAPRHWDDEPFELNISKPFYSMRKDGSEHGKDCGFSALSRDV